MSVKSMKKEINIFNRAASSCNILDCC